MEQKTIEAAKDLLQTVGFPIAVALWFMFRTDSRIDALRHALEALTEELRRKG